MKRVLLTGATGFIGYHLVRRLFQENVAVRCLVRATSSLSLLQSCELEYCTGDLSDYESLRRAVEGCDVVFHLAGLVRARHYKEFESVNHFGTENLARAAASCSSPPVLVYVSSVAAAGNSKKDQPKKETDPPLPVSKYGRSKLAGETALMSFADQIPCTIVRPGIVFGEADKMNLELFKTVKQWRVCPVPGFADRFYSWIHAADLSDLLVAAAQTGERVGRNLPQGTGIYFASSGMGMKMAEVGRLIAGSFGIKRVRRLFCPPVSLLVLSTVYEAKKWCTGKMQPLDWDIMWEAWHHWECSPEKARKQLNFSPQPMEKRFEQTAQWFLDNGWL